MSKQIVDEDWEKIFNHYVDTSKDLIFLSTKRIKEYSRKDLRLVTKFDCYKDQPRVFKEHGYFLLPLENRGDFAIVRGHGFQNVAYETPKKYLSRLGNNLESLSQGVSESQHLDYAYHTGLLETFLGQDGLHLTIRGRKYTPEFSFFVGSIGKLHVKSAQMEVDAGFENNQQIILFEAKIGTPHDFNIRQLFYPYRSWKIWVSHKDVLCVFITFNPRNNTYGLWQYTFNDDEQYNSISLVKNGVYHTYRQPTRETTDAQRRGKKQGRRISGRERLGYPPGRRF